MRVGLIGLGNMGGRLAGNLLRQGVDVTVSDTNGDAVASLVGRGATTEASNAALAASVDVVITCLPNPAVSTAVLEEPDGVLDGIAPGTIWAEMSTTDHRQVVRLGRLVADRGAFAIDCPVSGGCHRAATGNISIFVGGDRAAVETAMPLLTMLGRDVLHTGPLGSASMLKVLTNYLATANLVTLAEALVTAAQAGIDLDTAYEAIRISSGNSFVHETESQVILNGSRDINFTLGLVAKDIGLFQSIADDHGVPLEVSPLLIDIVADAIDRYGADERSPNVIRRLEDSTGARVIAAGFPAEIVDDAPPAAGAEVVPRSRR